MPISRPSLTDAALLLTMAAGACGLALSPAPQPAEQFIAAQHPTAVLAWAQTRCPWAGALKADAPKVHADDLIAVAAAFESKISYQPLGDVCAQALAIAGSAAEPPGTDILARQADQVASR